VPKTYDVERTASSTNVAERTGYLHSENRSISYLFPYTNINSKWTRDLNIRPESLKLVQERAGNTLELIGIENYFITRTPMAQQLRERIDKSDYMKLKSFFTTKEMVTR
jgi:hypothetical protein